MLDSFLRSLPERFPQACLELREPARSQAEAEARMDVLCQQYAEAFGCGSDVASQEAYLQHVRRLSEAIGAEPTQVQKAMEIGITAAGTLIGGATLAMILAEGTSYAADAGAIAADAAAHGLDLVDIWDATVTLGASVLLSLGVRWFFSNRNKAKRQEMERLTERVYLQGRLAKALLTPGKVDVAADCLKRLQECDTAAGARGGA